MEFAKVFRKSSLNHLVKDQVIAKSCSNSFHLKHEIFTNPKTITVSCLDDKDLNKSIYKSAWEQSDMQKRWFELFGPGITRRTSPPQVKPVLLSEPEGKLPMKKLDNMTKKEWKMWVKHALEKRKEFQDLLKKKEINVLGVNSFLGLDKLPDEYETYPRFYSKPALFAENRKDFQPVNGRIWARESSNRYIVLIAGDDYFNSGFTASLEYADIPKRYEYLKRSGYKIDPSVEYAFTVKEATLRGGKPQIKVSLEVQSQKLMDGLELLKARDVTNISSIPRPKKVKSSILEDIFAEMDKSRVK